MVVFSTRRHGAIRRGGCSKRPSGMASWAALLLLLLTLSPRLANGQVWQRRGKHSYAMETAKHDLERPPVKQQRGIVDLTNGRVLSRRQAKTLTQQLRKHKHLADIDLEVVVASNVEAFHTPKQMAKVLVERWDMGSQPHHIGGLLVLVVLEEQRIEIVPGDELAHIFDADWCHEVLYTKVVPEFQKHRYEKGLRNLFEALASTMKDVRDQNNAPSKSKRNRFPKFSLAALVATATPLWIRRLWPWWNPDGDDDAHHYQKPKDSYDRRESRSHHRNYDGPASPLADLMGTFLLRRAVRGSTTAAAASSSYPLKTGNGFVLAPPVAKGPTNASGATAAAGASPPMAKRRSSVVTPTTAKTMRGRLRDRAVLAAALRRETDSERGGGASWGRNSASKRPFQAGGAGASWAGREPRSKQHRDQGSTPQPDPGGGATW